MSNTLTDQNPAAYFPLHAVHPTSKNTSTHHSSPHAYTFVMHRLVYVQNYRESYANQQSQPRGRTRLWLCNSVLRYVYLVEVLHLQVTLLKKKNSDPTKLTSKHAIHKKKQHTITPQNSTLHTNNNIVATVHFYSSTNRACADG